MKTNKNSYVELLAQAQRCPSRKEALHLIHQADKLRMEMTSQPYPLVYGN